MINDPIFSNVSRWAEAIRNRQISASEVLRIHLAQIDKFNPTLNAINLTDAEKALERARAADEAIARGEFWGLLHGVPFTLKDAFP
jgi:amidase